MHRSAIENYILFIVILLRYLLAASHSHRFGPGGFLNHDWPSTHAGNDY